MEEFASLRSHARPTLSDLGRIGCLEIDPAVPGGHVSMPSSVLADAFSDRLALPAYSIVEAARYAGIHPNTVRRWYGELDVLGEREAGIRLSYLQLVEVAFVATFRRFGIPIRRIGDTHRWVASELGSQYPFVEYRFMTEGVHLLMDFQQIQPDIPADRLIVADRSGQLVWRELMANRFVEFDYDDRYGIAMRWHVGGAQSSVVLDPRIAYGVPSVQGVPTWAIRGRWKAQESVTSISQDFHLEEALVIEALAFEGIHVAA